MTPAQVTPLRLPEIEFDDTGMPVRARIQSASRPGRYYDFERSRAGRWMHTDTKCEGWVNGQHCYHIDALEALMSDMQDDTGTAVAVRDAEVLAKIDALDEQAVIASLTRGLSAEVSKRWVYSFQQGGGTVVGLSIDGVQEAARHLATKGEAIEQVWVKMDTQDEREAFFLACAVRYAISPGGERIELDRAIRAKRQSKYTRLRNGGEQFNDFWYEIGVAKALRNAVEALLPEGIKQHMIKYASRAAATRGDAAGRSDGAPARPAQGQRAAAAAGEKPVRARIQTLLTRAKDEVAPADYRAKMDQLRALLPHAFTAQGTIQPSKLTDVEAEGTERGLAQWLDGPAPAEGDAEASAGDEAEQGALV